MYIVSIFGTLLVLIALEILSRLFQPVFPKFHKLTIHVRTNEAISAALTILSENHLDVKSYQVKVTSVDNHPLLSWIYN